MSTTAGRDRRVVLLTGASGQVGTAFCERFAGTYDIVAVRHNRPLKVPSQHQCYIDPFAPEVAGASTPPPSSVFEIRADLRENDEIARVIELALARFGHIDALVNAVGSFDRRAELLEAALDPAPELFRINALVPMAVAVGLTVGYWRHHDLENAARNRAVVNLSATASVDADGPWGAVFSATKAAQNLLSVHLADELRPFHVRVGTIAPSGVPDVVSLDRVTAAIAAMLEGTETGRLLLMWGEDDELL